MVDQLRRRPGQHGDYRRCTRCSTRALASRICRAQVHRRVHGGCRHRDADRAHCRSRSATAGDGVIPVQMRVSDPAVRNAARDARRCRSPAAARAPASSSPTRSLFPGLRPASSSRDQSIWRPAPRCWPATARRWPRAPTAPRRSPTSPADRRHARPDPGRPRPTTLRRSRATRRTRKVGLDGWSGSSRSGLRARPAARCWPASACSRTTHAERGHNVHTTIDPTIERAAVAALGRPVRRDRGDEPAHRRDCSRWPGVAFSALQPPGSTMKIITATGALEARHRRSSSDRFPDADRGRRSTATRCRTPAARCAAGRLLNAFAVSCNSVFAPLGAKLGAKRFVAIAERFGFNQHRRSRAPRRARSPSASKIGGDARGRLVGDRPGHGAGHAARDDRRRGDDRDGRPAADPDAAGPPAAAGSCTSPARESPGWSQQMMVAVVEFGTGTAAQIPGVRSPARPAPPSCEHQRPQRPERATRPQNTDAWFVGYAPVGQAEDRRRGAVPRAGRRGRDGRAGRPRRARGRARTDWTGRRA